MNPDQGKRVIIENLEPIIDGGAFPAKRAVGETVKVSADVFCDGHDLVSASMRHRFRGAGRWSESGMTPVGNDRWAASFTVHRLGRYEFTVIAWVDRFKTWHHDLRRKIDAGLEVSMELIMGGGLVEAAAARARGAPASQLRRWSKLLQSDAEPAEKLDLALDHRLIALMASHPDKYATLEYPRFFEVQVDPPIARFSAWYELFPRSVSPDGAGHGTFSDCEAQLPRIQSLGFDVLYFPPIHPIGQTKRKGRNNALTAEPDDPGSPWAIGAKDGGHKSIHPDLGTLDDFRRLVKRARDDYGIEVALDIALQCSPDHPYVRDHPEWFLHRPDGTVQYAENPPKKYQDIYPFNFECEAWPELWAELKSIFAYWIDQGVRVFRVDNPHTKPFRFWDWVIEETRRARPEVIFLAEAFTRPKVMHRLAKGGFSQSYTYFTWRNTKQDLIDYMSDLTRTNARNYFRPNFWPNTPDILSEFLQHGGRPGFIIRLTLAATLSANYGIYGPAFELMEAAPRIEGGEEYLDSEKHQLRAWDIDRADSLAEYIARINRVRRDNPALHDNDSLAFHHINNDRLICFSKRSAGDENVMLMIANLDATQTQSGWTTLDLDALGVSRDQPFQVHDLISNARYHWAGPCNYVELNPRVLPAHVFKIKRRVRSEHDFDYFM